MQDWEWVLVPNGPTASIPQNIADHPKVHLVKAPEGLAEQGVGALKKFACSQCRGDYLVELDHDDLLTSDALETLDTTIAQHQDPGFLYSDFVNFYPDHRCQVYQEKFGWESYPFDSNGHSYTAMRSFAVNAASLHLIFYAPNHIRVWRRDLYESLGGHDATMSVADDHELLCRTYLSGEAMVHIPKVLYLYRMQDGSRNTHLERNAEIQRTQQGVSNRYTRQLVEQWCRRESLPMLDLGGRIGCPEGYQSVDLFDADINCDIRAGLPVDDNSVGCIRAYDFLEHIPHCPDSACQHGADGKPFCVVGMMNEIYRVLAPGGWLISRTPSTDGRGAYQDPTHCSFWNPNSFWYYTRRREHHYRR